MSDGEVQVGEGDVEAHNAERYVAYFHQGVLAAYRDEPHRYALETDDFEGHLASIPDSGGEIVGDYIEIKFGYRTLQNGEVAIAIFGPHLRNMSEQDLRRWGGFHISEPQWPDTPDDRFARWFARYLEGSWAIENGTRWEVEEVVQTINALTKEVVGIPMFKFPRNPILSFPRGENTHAYQDAHRELYGYLVDGLDKASISALAVNRGMPLNVANDNTRKALERALPGLTTNSDLWSALELISQRRRAAGHGVRPPATSFPASQEFAEDLKLVARGLQDLLHHLEAILGISGDIARKRQTAMDYLPQIVATSPAARLLPNIEGKTIERVEYGMGKEYEGCHRTEVLHIHFTDGSVLGVTTGSNSANVASDHEGVSPEEFHTDFIFTLVPPAP